MRKAALALLLTGFGVACGPAARTPSTRPQAPQDSGLLYIDVHARPAARKIRLDAAWAIRDDGERTPLSIERGASAGSRAVEERWLAWGFAGPGAYRALVIGGSQDGDEVNVEIPFVVTAGRGTVLDVTLEARMSEEDEAVSRVEAASARVVPVPTTGALALVASRDAGFVLLLDKRTGIVGGAVPTGRGPSALALDIEARRAYVVTSLDDDVEAIDLERPAILSRRPLHVGDRPVDVALLPDRRTLAVVNHGSGSVAFVETEGFAEIDRVQVGTGPIAIEVDEQGRLAFVSNNRGSSITVLDLQSRIVAATIPVDPGPVRGQLDRAQRRLWVAHDASPFLTAIDTRTLTVERRIQIGTTATALSLDRRTDRILLARSDGTGIDVFEPLSPLPVDRLALPGRVRHMEIDPETNLLIAVIPDEHLVRSVGLVARTPTWMLRTDGPAHVAVVGAR